MKLIFLLFFFLDLSRVILKKSLPKENSPENEVPVPEGDEVNYTFSGMGHLIYRNQIYCRSFARGRTFMSIYKCLEFKAKKCPAMLKTRGKFLASIVGHHNHN